ncbi:MAG: phosphonate metabolism protein/1,5-bisphosphokinase (PRPP-forming) PhnN [Hyphomicrobiales bacterium]|jgi:ribose 1,5-bisphosphokinase
MSGGKFIAVVGPSGVGKDSVMNALCAILPDMVRCRRVITRAADAGGEDYEPVDEEAFRARVKRGDFALWWQAHGLSYGIPQDMHAHLDRGSDVIANLSRSKLIEAQGVFPHLRVLSITAKPAILEQRLADRGRETTEDRNDRLARARLSLPNGLPVIEIDNSGDLNEAVVKAYDALQLASG